MPKRAPTTDQPTRPFGVRSLGASTAFHVLGIASVGALIAWHGARTIGSEPRRIVTARLERRAEPTIDPPEPTWRVEAPPEVADDTSDLRETELPDEPLEFDDEPVETTTVEVAWWNEPLDLPRFHLAKEESLETAGEPASELVPEEVPVEIIGYVEVEPVLLESSPPTYPALAQRRGWQGSVTCNLEIDAYGKVVGATVAATSGHEVLDEAALEAVRTWRFIPGTRNGRIDSFQVRHRVTFQLRR